MIGVQALGFLGQLIFHRCATLLQERRRWGQIVLSGAMGTHQFVAPESLDHWCYVRRAGLWPDGIVLNVVKHQNDKFLPVDRYVLYLF